MPKENLAQNGIQEENLDSPMAEEVLYTWNAKEFDKRDFEPWKIAILAFIAFVIVIWALIVANYLFALLVVMAAVVTQLFIKKEPADVGIVITNFGVKVDDKNFSFDEDLRSFWILYSPPSLKTLNFDRKQALLPGLTLQLDKENPIKIREALLNYLPEDTEKEEDISEKTARRFGI